MLRKIQFLLVLVISACHFASSQSNYVYYNIQNPHSFSSGYGTIDEATFEIKPKGVFAEVGVYLTFSAKDALNRTTYSSISLTDTLEVQYYFSLPTHSIMIDSWLWVENDVVIAKHLDRSEAKGIYENIVKRIRRDPSILYKNYQGNFELRVYPMKATETRKVKFTYLVPFDWRNDKIELILPQHLINPVVSNNYYGSASYAFKGPSTFSLIVHTIAGFESPVLNTSITATVEAGKIKYSSIPVQTDELKLSFTSPMTDGVYFKNYEENGTGYYQIAVNPISSLAIKDTNKVAIVVAYDTDKTTLPLSDVIKNLADCIKTVLSDSDYFNFFYANNGVVHKSSDSYIAATDANIDTYINTLKAGLAGMNNIGKSLLKENIHNAISFINTNTGTGKLLIYSNCTYYKNVEVANKAINYIKTITSSFPKSYVYDYANKNSDYIWNSTLTSGYRGDGYFFNKLNGITKGEFLQTYSQYYYYSGYNYSGNSEYNYLESYNKQLNATIKSELTRLLNNVDPEFEAFDGRLHMTSGFGFDAYQVSTDVNFVNLRNMYIQVGRYKGTAPFILNIAGEYNSIIYTKQWNIATNLSDSTVKKTWIGSHIRKLENNSYGYYNSKEKQSISAYALSGRVLSTYTAFLALEPAMGGQVCQTCTDPSTSPSTNSATAYGDIKSGQNAVTDILKDTLSDNITVQIAPNPFSEKVTISLKIPHGVNARDVSAEIYSLQGIKIHSFNIESIDNTIYLEWNGTTNGVDKIAQGMYLLNIRTAQSKKVYKLMFNSN